MVVKRLCFSCLFLIGMFVLNVHAQYLKLNFDLLSDYKSEAGLYEKNNSSFTSIRPFYFQDVYAGDTSIQFAKYYCSLFATDNNNLKFFSRLEPIIEGSLHNQNSGMLSMGGLKINTFTWYKLLSLQISANIGTIRPLAHTKDYIEKFNVFPEYGIVSTSDKSTHHFIIPELTLHVKLSKHINSEIGFGTHFFGDGHRSLILSNSHFSYPYVNVNAQIWKLKYVSLFAWMNDIYYPQARTWSDGISKFMALHYLSWNVTKRLNLSLFETVVAPLYDSLMPRQFAEYNYLLPTVMYRPLDFAIGSNDNMLLGANISYIPINKHVLYAQLVFDELFVNELRADILQQLIPDSNRLHGAWVNKQSYQFGYKSFDFLGLNGFDVLSEFNIIRPYMYSHRDVMQNYSHMNQPLAHPMGANLVEHYSRVQYRNEKWLFSIIYSRTSLGLDSVGTNVGQNIFLASFDAKIPEIGNIPVSYYGNKIGQGLSSKITFLNFNISRLIFEDYNIFAETGCIYRKQEIETMPTSKDIYFYASIKWGIGHNKIDY